MFDVFRTLFLTHEAVAHDWAFEHAFVEGQLIAAVRDRYRRSDGVPPSADALYEGIQDAMTEGEPDVAVAFTLELDRILSRGRSLDPTGTWHRDGETVAIARRASSDHPGDYWVVQHLEGQGARTAAARFVTGTGTLAFTTGARALDAPWTLLDGPSDHDAPVWVKASGVRRAKARGWRLGDAWVDPRAVRGRDGLLARRSDDPRFSGFGHLLDALADRFR